MDGGGDVRYCTNCDHGKSDHYTEPIKPETYSTAMRRVCTRCGNTCSVLY